MLRRANEQVVDKNDLKTPVLANSIRPVQGVFLEEAKRYITEEEKLLKKEYWQALTEKRFRDVNTITELLVEIEENTRNEEVLQVLSKYQKDAEKYYDVTMKMDPNMQWLIHQKQILMLRVGLGKK